VDKAKAVATREEKVAMTKKLKSGRRSSLMKRSRSELGNISRPTAEKDDTLG
jgi:cell division protein FtsB